MRKPGYFFLIFSFCVCGPAMADTIGLRVGLFADTPDMAAEERQFFLSPQLEYKHTFGRFDVYAKGQYTISLTELYPQFFLAEEGLAVHLPLGSISEFLIGLHHENDFRFSPDRGRGTVKPRAGFGLFLPPGDFSLALEVPLTYLAQDEGTAGFGLEVTAAYVTPFWLGFEAAATCLAAGGTDFESVKFAVNYTGDYFYGELAFKAQEALRCFSLRAEFNYFFDFFILWGALEGGDLGRMRGDPTAGAAAGIKYRF
jgi:hypothetical protein